MQESKALHYILGTSLLMIAVFAVSAFVMVNSQAGDSNANVGINPTGPTITSKFLSATSNAGTDDFAGSPIALTPGGNYTIWFNGVVADNNGEADLGNVDIDFYRADLAANCSNDTRNCYHVANCAKNGAYGTGLEASFNCSTNIVFFADSTSTGGEFPGEAGWTMNVKVTDLGGLNSSQSVTREMGTLTSLSIPGNINYGSLALGTDTTGPAGTNNNTFITIAQAGNDVADVEVSMAGSALNCVSQPGNVATGSIPRANLFWSLTDVSWNGSGATALTGSPVDTNLAVDYQHNGTPVSKDLHWNVRVPATGVGGTCAGPVTISTVAA